MNGNRENLLLRALKDRLDATTPAAIQRIDFPAPKVTVQPPDLTGLTEAVEQMTEVIAAQPKPEVNVTNTVESAEVVIDMTPVAEAIDRMTKTFVQNTTDLIAELIKAIAKQPPIIVAPTPIVVKPAVVNVAAPNVTLTMPTKPKRQLVIKHGENESTIIEK